MTQASKLTPKQQLFCEYYIESLNATDAARRAGYSPKSCKQQGTENLSKQSVMDGIDLAMEERRKSIKLDQSWVLKQILLLLKDAQQADDRTTVRYCLDMIAKHTALYSQESTVHHVYDGMSDAELDLAIKQAEQELAAIALH